MKVQNLNTYPVDVPGGPVLATADVTEVESSAELRRYLDAGSLVEVPLPPKSKREVA